MKPEKERHILFVGGGTGGHIAPLLAVLGAVHDTAERKEYPVKLSYVGLPTDLESPLVKGSKLPFAKHMVHSGKLHRHMTLNHFSQVKGLMAGLREARILLKKLKPDVVFAKGGGSTIPVALAAARMRIPIVCHESDANPGLAIRFIAKFAKVVCTAYPAKVYTQLPRRRIVHTGQPVRDIFYIQAKTLPNIEGEVLDPKKPLISVVCGSQGSRRVNQLVSEVWEKLLDDFQVVHVTGPHEHALYTEKRKQLSKFQRSRLHVVSFLTDELPALYQKSAVVISRSGGSIAELAASRACSILIPLSTAAQNHQWANARVVVGAGAAVALDETTATPQELEKLIRELMSDEREQTGLRAAIGHFDYPDAALRMADLLLDA